MTIPLFPNELTVLIEPTISKTALTKPQKQFNTLVKKIEKLKAQLVEWHELVPRHNERLNREYQPLRASFNLMRIELITLLDRARTEKRLTKNETKKLRHLIPSITAELMTEQPSDAVKELHDKYSDVGYDEKNEDVDDAVKAMMGEVFGLDVGDDVDINDPEQLRAVLEQQAQAERERQQESDTLRTKGKKTARQITQEQQKKSDAALVQKSLQEVFRKLVAALHPDRAPDDAERERRTELMQRVNVAYEKKNLLQLLELQIQVDQVGVSAQSDERLKHFNTLLQEQTEVLAQALAEVQNPFRFQLGLPPHLILSVSVVVMHLEQDIRRMKTVVTSLRHDLHFFQDTAQLKSWLRDFKIPKEPEFDDLMEEFMMSPFRTR